MQKNIEPKTVEWLVRFIEAMILALSSENLDEDQISKLRDFLKFTEVDYHNKDVSNPYARILFFCFVQSMYSTLKKKKGEHKWHGVYVNPRLSAAHKLVEGNTLIPELLAAGFRGPDKGDGDIDFVLDGYFVKRYKNSPDDVKCPRHEIDFSE